MSRRSALLAAILTTLAMLVWAADAQAMTLGDAEAVAGEYFPQARVNCPALSVEWGITASEADPDAIGVTYPAQCKIFLDRAYLKPRLWRMTCLITTHEFGHAAGERFPEDTADPAHSLDPDNIMYPIVTFDHLDGVTGCLRAEEQRKEDQAALKVASSELRESVAAYRAARRRARQAATVRPGSFRATSARALDRHASSLRPPRRLFEARNEAEARLDCAENQEGLTPHDYCIDRKGEKTWP